MKMLNQKETKRILEIPATKTKEGLLVVAREALYPSGAHHGLLRLTQEDLREIVEIISQNAQFLPRFQVEEDPTFKQIIPYMVFIYQTKVFLMQRGEESDGQTDPRLANLYSLGIGGHIRKDEFVGTDIFGWARREFGEEVEYSGNFVIKPLGLLNDDTAPVHAVHTGLVLLLEGDSPDIRIRDELKTGELKTLEECSQVYDRMENWSKIVFDELRRRKWL